MARQWHSGVLGVIGIAFAAGSPAQSADAQPADAQAALPEVVVTAQKREESLQDTPISIAVLNSDALTDRGIGSLSDFVDGAVPSLHVVPVVGRSSMPTVVMRGIGSIDTSQISRDATVGIYVDGIYLGRVQGLNTELFDVERIEVLRGPQGTLFGRNAVGGAVSIVSKKPTGEWGFGATLGVGNYDSKTVSARVNFPRVGGVSVKLEGVWRKRDGWVDNTLAGQSDWYDSDRRGGRASVLWDPIENLEVQYSYDKSRDESTAGYSQIGTPLPGAPPLAPMFSPDVGRVHRGRLGVPLQPGVGDVEGHGLHVTWNLSDDVLLRSITSYRELNQTQFDNDAGATVAFRPNSVNGRYSLAGVAQHQFSQELQLAGSTERLKYVAGLFYYDEDASDWAYVVNTIRFNATGTDYTVLPTPVGGPFPDRASTAHARSKAVFGQATWTPPLAGDRLHVTGGLRWTNDKKDGLMTALRGAPTPYGFDFESKRTDPMASVAFDWTDRVNTYLRWGTAYRAGGANSRSPTYGSFGEEELASWELGLKADFPEQRIRLNAAAFDSEYRDMQLFFTNPANPSLNETINTKRPPKIKGLELDLTAIPLPGLSLTASYTYTDGKMPPQLNPFSGQVERVVLVYAPRNAGSLAVDFDFKPWTFAALTAHLDANYSSGYYSSPADPELSSSYWILNGRLTLREIALGNSGGTMEVALWGKNLTDKDYDVADFPLAGPFVNNLELQWYNDPRTYGVEFRFKF